MPCRGVSLPEMGCPAMDLFCFFVDREKFFFHSANFSCQVIEIGIGLKFEKYKTTRVNLLISVENRKIF